MAPQSEALRQAKLRYYQKKREDPEYMEMNRLKTKKYVEENKEKHNISCLKYYEAHKDDINGRLKEKRDRRKIDDVKAKLEQIDTEQLAKILIAARKTRLLEEVF